MSFHLLPTPNFVNMDSLPHESHGVPNQHGPPYLPCLSVYQQQWCQQNPCHSNASAGHFGLVMDILIYWQHYSGFKKISTSILCLLLDSIPLIFMYSELFSKLNLLKYDEHVKCVRINMDCINGLLYLFIFQLHTNRM